jgi:hypothetical protein
MEKTYALNKARAGTQNLPSIAPAFFAHTLLLFYTVIRFKYDSKLVYLEG